jgi:hypothetical protein
MADNTNLPEGGQIGASDEIEGVKYQRVKIAVGPDGTALDASDASPVPIGGDVQDKILTVLKKIEFHLAAMSGEDVSDFE